MPTHRVVRAAAVVLLGAMLLARCTTPTSVPSRTPLASATATAVSSPTPSATPRPARTSVDLGVPAGDTYTILYGALDAERGILYALANEGDARDDAGVLTVIDLRDGKVRASAPLPVVVDWMSTAALSADRTRLYVSGRAPGQEQVVAVVVTGVDSRPLGEVLGVVSDANTLALDGTGGHLYVADENRLRRLDALSLAQEATTDLPDAIAPNFLLAINPHAGRVCVCDSGGNAIFVYRADDLQLRRHAGTRRPGLCPGGQS